MMEVLGIDPVAIQLGPLSIRWYGIIIASGILIGYLMAQSTAKKVGIKEETLIDLIIWCVVMAIICARDRKSTRLNSSHVSISYAVFCLKKKKKKEYS